jgi:hypothetical protein
MAKVVVTFDTNSKALIIKNDGQEMEDVHEIAFGCIGEDADGNEMYQMVMRSMVMDEDNSMSSHTSTYAKKMDEYKKNDVQSKIQKFFADKYKA